MSAAPAIPGGRRVKPRSRVEEAVKPASRMKASIDKTANRRSHGRREAAINQVRQTEGNRQARERAMATAGWRRSRNSDQMRAGLVASDKFLAKLPAFNQLRHTQKHEKPQQCQGKLQKLNISPFGNYASTSTCRPAKHQRSITEPPPFRALAVSNLRHFRRRIRQLRNARHNLQA